MFNFCEPQVCGQTVLPERLLIKRQKLVKNAKVKKFNCDIFGNFQKICSVLFWPQGGVLTILVSTVIWTGKLICHQCVKKIHMCGAENLAFFLAKNLIFSLIDPAAVAQFHATKKNNWKRYLSTLSSRFVKISPAALLQLQSRDWVEKWGKKRDTQFVFQLNWITTWFMTWQPSQMTSFEFFKPRK